MRAKQEPKLVGIASAAVTPVLVVLHSPLTATAHPAAAGEVHRIGEAWNWDPLVLVNLTIVSLLYVLGTIRRRSRRGRPSWASLGQRASSAGSLLVLMIALVSPLDALSDELSSMHMVQHMLLVMLAAPLFILGSPGLTILWALPVRWRRAIRVWPRRFALFDLLWRVSWSAGFAWTAHAVTLWVWHLPALYEAALYDPYVHDLQHLTFFIAACLFWRVVIDPTSRLRLNPGLGLLYLFTTSLHATALGVFMTLSPRLWYPTYAGTTLRWGLSPVEDQQLAGLIMWMPACAVYTLAAAALFGFWLRALAEVAEGGRERPSRRAPQARALPASRGSLAR